MPYNFDEIIDRRHTNSLNTDGWKQYIFGKPGDTPFAFADEDYVRMWVADMDFATPPEVLDAVRGALDHKIMGYTRIFDPSYGEALKSWMKRRYGWDAPMEHMVVSPGIIPALNRLAHLLCAPGDKVLIAVPSSAPFKGAADYNGLTTVYSPLTDNEGYYTIDFADLEQKAKDPSTTLLIFCSPHNPSGRIWTEEELARVERIARENGMWLICDEIHCDLLRCGNSHVPMAKLFPENKRIITCTAPSKTFNLAGNLTSHIFIPDEEVRGRWMKLYNEFLNPLQVAATQAAYTACDNWLEELKVYLDGNFNFLKEYLRANLPEAKFRIPEATYLAWVDVRAYLPQEHWKRPQGFFADKGAILLEGGDMFVSNGDGRIRLNMAVPKSVVAEGARRVCACLKGEPLGI